MSTLETLRKRRNLTQEELAQRAEVGRTTIAKIEAGKAIPRPETIRRICKVLGVDESRLRVGNRVPAATGDAGSTPRTRGSDRAAKIEQSGIVERLSADTYGILLDQYMSEQAQLGLYGASMTTLTLKPGTMLRRLNGATNYLHVHGLLEDVLYTLAVEAEDPPSLDEVTAHGVVLRSIWFDDMDDHCQLVFVPWSQVLGISTVMQSTSRATSGS